ncbi:MAG: hypothetical protein GXO87_15195 [Chlorobi bacterium]|nr:hypothetical protein [Chlorobiota bacterium]
MRTSQTNAYGTNALKDLGSGYYGVYSGDCENNGTIDSGDRNTAWNNRNSTGYYDGDVNLDGVVDSYDRNKVWNNRNVAEQVPAVSKKSVNKIKKEK